MDQIVNVLRGRFPAIAYTPGSLFYWSPKTKEVFYTYDEADTTSVWSLLHETGHALLNHTSYRTDFELIKLEVAAWEQAKLIAVGLDIAIDEDHIQNCLDTYRDWLCARSICPRCNNRALQQTDLHYYQCFNCHMKWRVTPSRFCRVYRTALPDEIPLSR